MTKNKEIEIITKLCTEDTYFAQFFGKYLHAMRSNIINDFGIETNLVGGDKELIEFDKKEIQLMKTVVVQTISFYVDMASDIIADKHNLTHKSLENQCIELNKLIEKLANL